jgi:hypothetical protein
MTRPKLNPNQEIITINLRLPSELKLKIQERAVKNYRSVNQEIVWMLQKAIYLLEKEPSQEDK